MACRPSAGQPSPATAAELAGSEATTLIYFVRGHTVVDIATVLESNRDELERSGIEVGAIDVPGSANMSPVDAHNAPVTTYPHASLAIVAPFLQTALGLRA